MNIDQQSRFNLITQNLQEVIGEKELLNLCTQDKPLNVYWGTAPTGKPHFGYLQPMLKIADLVDAGCNVTILLADLHAFLDNSKSPMNKVQARTEYYKRIITSLLEALNVDISKIKFRIGSEYQLSKEYVLDLFQLGNVTTVNLAKHAGAEVVKQSDNPLLTSLLYPLMQALDEQYLDADIELGGVDQRKIFMYARENTHHLGYKKRIYLMNQMIPSLSSVKPDTEKGKMSSSEVNSKIDILDTPNTIKKKINVCYCLPGDVDNNNLLLVCKKVIFPILKRKGQSFTIDRPEKYGGPIVYENQEIDRLVAEFGSSQLHPMDLKSGIVSFLTSLFEPIRTKFASIEMIQLTKQAYE